MPSEESCYRASLKECLDRLIQNQYNLVDQLQQQFAYPVYVQGVEHEFTRIKLGEHILQMEYAHDEMKAGETVSFQGVCGTTTETLQSVQDINSQRGELHQLLMAMDKVKTTNAANESVRLSSYALQQLGYARFNRRQAVRKFNVFEQPLSSVSYFWASQRRIIKASVPEVRTDLLKKLENASDDYRYYLQADMEHLDRLPADEVLYYVYQKNDHPRANYVLQLDGSQKRGSCMASNPFFYRAKESAPLPRIRDLPSLTQRAPRLSRTDKTINDTPYLSSIHVHRLEANTLGHHE